MFLELWERLRGYDRWVETQATVERSDVSATTYGTRSGEDLVVCEAGDVISWSDASGEKQYATFDVEEGNSLFELVTGESVTIRYDPARPTASTIETWSACRSNLSAGESSHWP